MAYLITLQLLPIKKIFKNQTLRGENNNDRQP